MDKWLIGKKADNIPKINNPIFIEGLPGIGNVGKIAVDFLIDQLNPSLIYEIHSTNFPHSVFVNDDNLIEMPAVRIYLAKTKVGRNLLLLAGDVQPVDESASYEFSNLILDIVKKLGCKEVITLGGIGTAAEPIKPKVYGAAISSISKERYGKLSKSIIFNKTKADAIIGATGLLLGLAKLKKMEGSAILVETFANQFHIGLKESKNLLKALIDIIGVDVNLSELDEEIVKEEKERKKDMENEKKTLHKTVKRMTTQSSDMSYIG
tara:strand:+ start:205 stop:999 length:795 start_codon:yes stop_codon:yes gene_type:complete